MNLFEFIAKLNVVGREKSKQIDELMEVVGARGELIDKLEAQRRILFNVVTDGRIMRSSKKDIEVAVVKALKEMTNLRDSWRETPRINETLEEYLTKRNHYVSYYEGAVYALEMLETWALEAKKERKKLAKKAKDDAQVYRPSEMPEDLYYEGAVYALEMLETWALEAKLNGC